MRARQKKSVRSGGLCLLSVALFAGAVSAFVGIRGTSSSTSPLQRRRGALFLSAEEENEINSMRRLLEASWNVETMGSVPTDANAAAESAACAITYAMTRTPSRLFYVDLLLPQYDIRQGSNLYDEVLAVEFCIALSMRLTGKTAIVVRDDKTIRTVSRILDARENDRQPSSSSTSMALEDDDEDDDEDDKEQADLIYNDFDDFGVIGGSSVDVGSFRDQLITGWRKEQTEEESDPAISSAPIDSNTMAAPLLSSKVYRLASMLGSASISSGPDMLDDVVRAVAANGQPNDDEGTVIILSAASREEMIGVRSLVSKYEGKKTIVLVNCSLDPIPRELIRAQTVYSIQPFIARPKVSDTNIFGTSNRPTETTTMTMKPPKIVLMRRFPRDWEIFVDIGSGFELAQTVPADRVDKKGPSMQFIAACVKQFMQSRQ